MGWLWDLAPLRSPLPVFLNAWRIVSTIISLPLNGGLYAPWDKVGLAGAPGTRAFFAASMPFMLGAPLVGGLVPTPREEAGLRTGDLVGEGERFAVVESDMWWTESRLVSACSAWTTSAKTLRQRRRRCPSGRRHARCTPSRGGSRLPRRSI